MIVIRKSFVAIIGISSIAFAQNPDRSATCWRPRALASCKSWIVIESAAETRIASSRDFRYDAQGRPFTLEDPLRVSLTGGAMINVSASNAIGLTAAAVSGDTPHRFEARIRHWDGDLGIDFTGGIRAGLNAAAWRRAPSDRWLAGYAGSVGISRRYIGGDVRMDAVRLRTGRFAQETFVTVRTGSWAGLAATPLILLVAALQSMD
jgi:hypothetical protein